MSRKIDQGEEPTFSKPYAFACDEHKKMKGNKMAPSSSSSSEKEEQGEDDDDEEDYQASTYPSRTKKQSDALVKVA
jgi:hypothetical protein